MLDYLEMQRVGPGVDWVEVEACDSVNERPCLIHLPVRDAQEMAAAFAKRYQSKQEIEFRLSDGALSHCASFFHECLLAHALVNNGSATGETLPLLETSTLNFRHPEKTSLRQSRTGRIKLFLDDAFASIKARQFAKALKRLDWVHLLDESNELAFELKVVALRSTRNMAECIRVFEQWTLAHPQAWEPCLGLGEAWLYLDQNQKAREVFSKLVASAPQLPHALIGLAQAKARLGEEFLPELLKASMLDGALVKETVEHRFDFRMAAARDLVPMTLIALGNTFQIPLKRLLGRAQRGVVPLHLEGSGLASVSALEMQRYYQVLLKLGLELPPLGAPLVLNQLNFTAGS
jgi:hypothetical protein